MKSLFKNINRSLKEKCAEHKKLTYIFKKIILPIFVIILIVWLLNLCLLIGNTKIGSIKNLTVYTDNLTYKEDIMHVMDTCIMELEKKNITTKSSIKIIFCTTTEKYNQATFYLEKGTLGTTQQLLKVILLAPANYKDNILNENDENRMIRKLSGAIIHEIAHIYVKEQIGFLKSLDLTFREKWKDEGFCEYIANESSMNIEDGKRIFIENGEEQKKIESIQNILSKKNILYHTYFYFKSRLKTDYLFSYKHISFDDFFSANFDEETLENEIREALLSGKYVFDKQ